MRTNVHPPRKALAAAAVLVATLPLAAGCGGSGHPQNRLDQTTPATLAGGHAITISEARTLRLGGSQGAFEARYGTPATPLRSQRGGLQCDLYYTVGYTPAQYMWQVCFKHGRVHVISTYFRH